MENKKAKVTHPTAAPDFWRADDDWTEVKEKEQRKRRQNRLNQRAYRRRNAQKESSSKDPKPFSVERFRIVEVPVPTPMDVTERRESRDIIALAVGKKGGVPEKSALQRSLETLAIRNSVSSALHSVVSKFPTRDPPVIPFGYEPIVIDETFSILIPPAPIIGSGFAFQNNLCEQNPGSLAVKSSFENGAVTHTPTVYFPLSSDHLLHLIHHNVFRALITNKGMLKLATILQRKERAAVSPSFDDLCDGLTTIHSKPDQIIPPTLDPTHIQMTVGHSSWLNMFPHPRVRDNLIKNEGSFDAYDFCNDVFGELVALHSDLLPKADDPFEDTDDNLTYKRRGLIVWGEPWDVEGWEVMPGFVRKWSWVLEGCEDLIMASNHWRAKRNEEPLRIDYPKQVMSRSTPSVVCPMRLSSV